MTDITEFVYHDGKQFYFDPENYSGDINKSLSIGYEDGDMVKWLWEGKKMSGILREQLTGLSLFTIERTRIIG
jgi:hypothetical protein